MRFAVRSGRDACRKSVVDDTTQGYQSGKDNAANGELFQTVAILPPPSIYRRLNQLLHGEGSPSARGSSESNAKPGRPRGLGRE